MTLTIIRHGKTKYNIAKKRQGKKDSPLSDIGREFVQDMKKKLKDDFTAIIVSPLKRTRQTAKILFPNREFKFNELIICYDFGELEGVPFSEPLENFPDNRIEEHEGKHFLMPKEGESFEDVIERCKKFIKYLKENFKENDNIAIVSHSTFLSVFLALAENKPWYKYLVHGLDFDGFKSIEI